MGSAYAINCAKRYHASRGRLPAGDSLHLPLTQLARRTAEPVTSPSDAHLVNNSAAYMQLKKLVQADKQRAADGGTGERRARPARLGAHAAPVPRDSEHTP